MERAIVACFYGSGVDGPFLVACFYGSGASTGRSRSRSGLGSCGGCCASNGAIFRHPGCPLVLFVLTETVIEYAGRRAARYGAAMRQHVREGTELLACAALSELILSEALPSRLCSDGSCSRARLARRVFHSMLSQGWGIEPGRK